MHILIFCYAASYPLFLFLWLLLLVCELIVCLHSIHIHDSILIMCAFLRQTLSCEQLCVALTSQNYNACFPYFWIIYYSVGILLEHIKYSLSKFLIYLIHEPVNLLHLNVRKILNILQVVVIELHIILDHGWIAQIRGFCPQSCYDTHSGKWLTRFFCTLRCRIFIVENCFERHKAKRVCKGGLYSLSKQRSLYPKGTTMISILH